MMHWVCEAEEKTFHGRKKVHHRTTKTKGGIYAILGKKVGVTGR